MSNLRPLTFTAVLVFVCVPTGREKAQELSRAGPLHALLHPLQEPRAQLPGEAPPGPTRPLHPSHASFGTDVH